MGYPRKSKREDQRSQPLLTTKLYVPSPRPDWVSRPRLLEYLDEALPDPAGTSGRKLVLVSAPAGYGKTTLLAEWLEGIQCPVAWLSLDEGDDDASRFLAYLTAALESIPQFPPSLGPDDSEASGEAQLAALLNRASRLSEPVILVLDDFHRVTASTVVEYVGHL